MGMPMTDYTFESLTRLSPQELEPLIQHGTAPKISDLLGYEFRGWNIQWAARLIGSRKFKKGFFGNPAYDYAWGYNMQVQQNALEEPWIAKPSDEDPKRFFFYKVYPATAKSRYPNTLVIDYHAWGEYFPLNPVGYTVDYLVYPDSANQDLIVANSYLETPLGSMYLGHFILERSNESGYDRDSHFLRERELRTVEAFAEVFIEGDHEAIPPREIAWNVDRYLERIRSNRTRSLRLLLFLIEYLLPRRSLWPFRPPFSKMSRPARRKLIEARIQNPRNQGPLRDLAKIKTLFLAGYYGDPRVYPGINFTPVEQRSQYQPDKLRPLGLPRLKLTAPSEETIRCEVCVIGSGAGGAVVACNASVGGKAVVLLEEGPYIPGDAMTHRETEMVPRLYKEGGLQSTVDLDMTILQGKTLGGTTTINNLICFRIGGPQLTPGASPDVLAGWEALGAYINTQGLNEAYDRVEEKIGVKGLLEVQEEGIPWIDGGNARVFLEGWRSLVEASPELGQYKNGLFRKNAQRCLGCGYCNFGCRYERKLSMAETYIPEAIENGARVIVGCHATEIETQGRRAQRVRCELADGRTLFVEAQDIVLACGAIGSSVLLMKSGLGRNVGTRFSFNAGTPVFARFPEPLRAFDGVQMAAYVDAGDYLLETLANPPLAHAVALPGWFGEHFARMAHYDRFASAGVLIGTEANGRVKKSSFLRSLFGPVAYKMTDHDLHKMRRGIAQLARLYFAAGAETVYPATFVDRPLERDRYVSRPDDLARVLETVVQKPDDLTLNSSHPQGGNPMSDDPSIGVVDSQFRVHGLENLYVCDASVFPTTIRINPQLSIMAMADYFWHLGVL